MKNTLSQAAADNLISMLLPKYGTRGLDIPIYDKDKHMYLVDQYQFDSGNWRLTYVALSDNILSEVVFGHYHGWEYMNKLRVMTPDGRGFKIIKTMEWPKCTRVDMSVIKESISDSIETYILSAPGADTVPAAQIKDAAEKMTSNLMDNTMDYLNSALGRQILLAYCEKSNLCKDIRLISQQALSA